MLRISCAGNKNSCAAKHQFPAVEIFFPAVEKIFPAVEIVHGTAGNQHCLVWNYFSCIGLCPDCWIARYA
jgi:hypothetical protein